MFKKILCVLLIVVSILLNISCAEKEHVHTEEEIPEIVATCTAPGKTAGTKCTECEEILLAPEDSPQLPHIYSGKACFMCGIERDITNEDIIAIRAKMKNAVNYLSYAASSYSLNSLYGYASDAEDEIKAVKDILDSRSTYVLNSGETLNQRVNEVYDSITYFTWRYASVNSAKDELPDVQKEVLLLELTFLLLEV